MINRKLHNLNVSLRCFRTPARVVVFESDDWGMDGMPSRQVYDELASKGLIDTANPFNKCGRETVEDLDRLYEVLAEFRDRAGRPAAFTTNFVMANPDFEAIEASGYRDYSWIAIDDFDRRPFQAALAAKYNEGVARGLICPQYHGRDHLSAESWLAALARGDAVAHAGFRLGVPMSRHCRFLQSEYLAGYEPTVRPLFRAAIDAKTEAGIKLFESTFGSPPLTCIPPFYLWHDEVEVSLHERGVRCMQAASHRLVPGNGGGSLRHRAGVLGERSASGMVYLVRNCWFRPSEVGETAVGSCLQEMASAFGRGYPAVIDTHRVNYVGAVDPAMRDANLSRLRELLRAITSRFHGVRFATSIELARSLLPEDVGAPGVAKNDPLVPQAPFARRFFWTAGERLQWWALKRGARICRGAPAKNRWS